MWSLFFFIDPVGGNQMYRMTTWSASKDTRVQQMECINNYKMC